MTEFSRLAAYTSKDTRFQDHESAITGALVAARAATENSLRLLPESETFKAEIDAPLQIVDEESGRTYGVYRVNRDQPGTPLVMNMSWSLSVASNNGRNELNAYAARLHRPITVIDMEGHGKSDPITRPWRSGETFDSLAAAHLRVVDQLGIDRFDLQGMSMGGVVATKMAQQAGDRVASLATVSMVGLENRGFGRFACGFSVLENYHQRRYIKRAPQEIRDTVDTSYVGGSKGVSTLLRLAVMMTKATVPEAIEGLSPNTRWYDFVGSNEKVTDWRTHMQVVRERNSTHPRSSSLHVLGGETHSWSSIYLHHVAAYVATVLSKEAGQDDSVTSTKRMLARGWFGARHEWQERP